MDKISPGHAYYLNLGEGSDHKHDCIEINQTIWVGFRNVPHELCVAQHWDEVRDLLKESHHGHLPTAASQRNQLRTFYEAGEEDLWITFYKGCLYWCFAGKHITILSDNSRTRPAKGGWRNTDIRDNPLEARRLSGALLSVQGYRATLCKVHEFDYLVRKINGEVSPDEQAALQAREAFINAIEQMIHHLTWKDFELLIDLLFRQAGWQRLGQVGKTQKSLDLDLLSPIRNERYLVQVKARADKGTFEHFQRETSALEEYACYYFAVHKLEANLTKELETDTHKLWLPGDIARLTVQYGLAEWVIDKAK